MYSKGEEKTELSRNHLIGAVMTWKAIYVLYVYCTCTIQQCYISEIIVTEFHFSL